MFVRAVSESFPKDGVVKIILDDTISVFLAGASDREGGGSNIVDQLYVMLTCIRDIDCVSVNDVNPPFIINFVFYFKK